MTTSTSDGWKETLRREFRAEDNRFLAIAQVERRWDKVAFREMVEAMRDACVRCADEDRLDRWMAHGFFYVPAFVRAWTRQPEFSRPQGDYWDRAIHLLEVLSHWFFWGEPPTQDGDVDVMDLE